MIWSRTLGSREFNASGARFARFRQIVRLIADSARTQQWYGKYVRPFLLKDPRLIWSLHLWAPLMARAGPLPLLLCVTRAHADILASHERREEKVAADELTTKIAWREWQLGQWPGPAIVFDITQLAGATAQNVQKQNVQKKRGTRS